ncbi:MAG: hypothetical protein ABR564_05550 [Candidatus Dormibacteria bacterium]
MTLLLVAGLAVACDSMGPSNIDLGLRVEASVTPRVLSLRDTSAVLHIRVSVSNSSEHDVIVVTGGPPYRIAGDPTESQGLSQSFRIASQTEALNAGPSVDWWGSPVDTIRTRHRFVADQAITLQDWQAGGWTVQPGEYRVRGYYNGREGAAAPFSVVP